MCGRGQESRTSADNKTDNREELSTASGTHFLFLLPFLKDFLREPSRDTCCSTALIVLSHGSISSRGFQSSKDYNLVPTIVERFSSRIEVQAFTAEKAPLTTAPAVGCELLFPIHDYIGRNEICYGYCVAIR